MLVLYTQTLATLAEVATDTSTGDLDALRSVSPLVHVVLALLVLLVLLGAMVLSVFKPKGLTARGWWLGLAGRGVDGLGAVLQLGPGFDAGFLEPPDELADGALHLAPLGFGVRGTTVEGAVGVEGRQVRLESGAQQHELTPGEGDLVRCVDVHPAACGVS